MTKILIADTDPTFAADSDYVVPSQSAVKAAVDALWSAIRTGLSLTWSTQSYTMQSAASSVAITLTNAVSSINNVMVFINGKTLVPNECLSLSVDGTTLTITNDEVMPSGLLFTIKTASLTVSIPE